MKEFLKKLLSSCQKQKTGVERKARSDKGKPRKSKKKKGKV